MTSPRQAPGALGEPTLCAAFQRTAAERPDAIALRTPGDRMAITWREYSERVRRLAEGLAAVGLRRGDTLALLLTNRPEFNLLDTAALHLGATPVSLYTVSPPEQIAYILGDSGARIAVTEQALEARLRAAVEHGARLDHVQMVEALDELESARLPSFDFEATWRAVAPEDLATVCYTSGTTGPPKGVEHTHATALAMCRSGLAGLDVRPHGRVISYLPSAHLADRTISHYVAIAFGFTTTACADAARVVELLPEVRPTLFASVPRVWELMRARLAAALGGDPGRHDERTRGEVRRRIGLDACEAPIVTAAPAQAETIAFFHALGVPLRDAYAMTEAAILTVSSREDPRPGSVGKPVPGVELRLAPDGEIVVRAESLTRGYRNRLEETLEAIDADGWFRTGDVGTLDAEGNLRIVDRKKELIINDAGKNISPANVEAALKAACPLIAHACLIGDGRPHNVALITLDRTAAAGVARANARLAPHEQVLAYAVLDDDWAPGGPELTATMKLRRRAIAERYAETIESLYAGRA